MATKPISRIQHLSARIEAHLHQFVSPMGEFNDSHRANKREAKDALRQAKRTWRDARYADNDTMEAARQKLAKTSHVMPGMGIGAGAGGAAGIAYGLRKAKGKFKYVNAATSGLVGAALGAGAGMEIGGRIRKKEKKNLSARIEARLHQFEPMDDETDYNVPKRKGNPMLRAGLAAGAVGAAAALAPIDRDKIKAGYQRARTAVQPYANRAVSAARTGATSAVEAGKAGYQSAKAAVPGVVEAGRTAGFRGMRGTAKMMNKGGNLANRAGAGGLGGALKKGAKSLRKNSMKLFNAELAATLVRMERKLSAIGA
jgi:hypothetical protein